MDEAMTSTERVMAAIEFRTPDRLPRWDNFDIFGVFAPKWRARKNVCQGVSPADYYGIDIGMCMPEEGPFFSRSGRIRLEGEYEVFRDSWGRVIKQLPGVGHFMETLEPAVSRTSDLDKLEFDDVSGDANYTHSD